jgi:uncharacterized membrane-anchored protein
LRKRLFYVAVGFQVAFLLFMSLSYYVAEDMGEIVTLRTEPVDPPDLFYGDYVRLSYEAERIPADKWFAERDIKYGDKVYVVLVPSVDGVFEVKSASAVKPNKTGDEVIIAAKYAYDDFENGHRVEFGINRFYIEDNTGDQFENQTSSMIAKVAILPWGLKRILSLKPSS